MRIPVGFPKIPTDWEFETEVHESLDHEHGIFFNIFKSSALRLENRKPKRALLIVHGQGEHGGRYQHFPHYLRDVYELIIAVDLRGHGRSEGIRGHVEEFDEYVDDVLLAWEVLKAKAGELTARDLFGHSMGGLVVLKTLLFRPDLGAPRIILSAPALAVKVPVPWVKEAAAQVLSKVWGSLQLNTGLNAKFVSHDLNVVEAYVSDQLNHSKATPSFYLSFKSAMQEVLAADFRLPGQMKLLLQLAGEDEIVSSEAAHLFFERLHLENKTEIQYPGLYHEIYNEPTKEKVFTDWRNWL